MSPSQSDHPGYGSAPDRPSKRRWRWPLVALIVGLMVLICGAFAAYAYDDSRQDEIADGVTIGGVDVGGLDADEARALLRRQLLVPLRKPLRVSFREQTFELPSKRLRVHADLEGAIDDALAASREGGLPSRVYRYVTGGTVEESIDPGVAYSQPAVNRFVRRIAAAIDREPVDATIEPSASSLNVVPAEPGRKVRDNLLTRQLNAAASSGRRRAIAARVHALAPEITSDEVAAAYPTYITVDQASFTVRVWKDLKLAREYTVAVGQPGYPTPYGLYSVSSKQVDPVWSVPNSPWAGELAGTVVAGGTAENPLKARWMGVTDGVGFHGTDATYSLGTAASHGCIRMAIDDIVEMYDMVPIGTPVYIG